MIVVLYYIAMLYACTSFAQHNTNDGVAHQAANAPINSLELIPQDPDWQQKINQTFGTEFLLNSVEYESDVYISAHEFFYLVDLPQGSLVTAAHLNKAISYLFKKSKFEKIVINYSVTPQGYALHLVLTGFWTVKKLKLHGGMIGKEKYRHAYLMEPGDPFTPDKHEKSLQRIAQLFHDEGYFNAKIESYYRNLEATKQVAVHCVLKKNERFMIDGATIAIKSDESMTQVDRDELILEIEKKFIKKINHGAFSRDVINHHIQRLKKELAQKGYIYVTITPREIIDYAHKKIHLHFDLDAHHKKEFVFSGNTLFTHNQLLDQLLEFGHSAWLLPASILAQEIKQSYVNKGFWSASVESSESDDCYYFAIHEGPRVTIKKVIINSAYDDPIPVGAADCFADVVSAKYYDQEILDKALTCLSSLYHQEGYWDASILKQDFVLLQDDVESHGEIQKYALKLAVDQGIKSYVTSISIEYYKQLETKGPFAALAKNDLRIPFDASLLQTQRQWLIDYFRKKGYLHADAKPEIVRENGQISITWKINRGQEKTKFGKTIVMGSHTFPFEYIQRELLYKEGDIWNQEAIKKSFLNLKGLDIFEHIHFSPDQITKQEPEKAVMLKLYEDDPFEVRVRAGLELQEFTRAFIWEGLTYRVGGTFMVKNPCNRGDRLIIDTDIAPGYRKALLNYQLPWFANIPLKTEFIIYSDQYIQPGFIGCAKNIYELTQHGMLIGLSKKYRFFDFGMNSGFEWMQTRIPDKSDGMCRLIDNIARAIDFNPRLLNRQVPYFQLEPTIMIDFLDQKMNPTHGSFSVLSLKGMFPLINQKINSYMLKALVEQSFFASLKSVVFGLRLRAGHIFFTKFNSIMPSERFYLGGANSVRSYDTDFAPPLGAFINEQDKICFVPQGGKTMLNMNAEVRFPIYSRLGGVLFQDVGILSTNRFADFDPKNILLGTGFGARLATPLGSLRFDVAWKWVDQPTNIRSYAWFLTFGQAF